MRKRSTGMWEYLDSVGVLEKGSDAEIKEAKRTYRKQYLLNHKRKQRSRKAEYSVSFSRQSGDHHKIVVAARRHHKQASTFIREATLAYLDQRFLNPDPLLTAHLEQLLSDCLNEIKSIVSIKEKFFWQRDQKIENIEKRIMHLEKQINELFNNPRLVTANDCQNQIT